MLYQSINFKMPFNKVGLDYDLMNCFYRHENSDTLKKISLISPRIWIDCLMKSNLRISDSQTLSESSTEISFTKRQ